MIDKPGEIYKLVYGPVIDEILKFSNLAIDEANENRNEKIQHISQNEIQFYLGFCILTKLEKGESVPFQKFYSRMVKKTYNPFDFCENALNNINFVTFKRFCQIHRFFYQSPRVKFVPKKVWKKSSSKSNPDGGNWEF